MWQEYSQVGCYVLSTYLRSGQKRLRVHPMSLVSALAPFEERIFAHREPLLDCMLLVLRQVFHIYPTDEREKAIRLSRCSPKRLARWIWINLLPVLKSVN